MRRVLIAGPGRSGTSALVRLIGELGFDTSADGGTWNAAARAGFESQYDPETSPTVVKNPQLTWQLPELLESGAISADEIRVVLIPFRDLQFAAASRWENTRRAKHLGASGGLIRTRRPTRQADVLAQDLWGLLIALEEHDVPYRLVHYPRFMTDKTYVIEALGAAFPELDSQDFEAAWEQVRDPSLVRSDIASHPTLLSDAQVVQWTIARPLTTRMVRRIKRTLSALIKRVSR